nr:hypothetical protein [Tanacetum cinerariifolium]
MSADSAVTCTYVHSEARSWSIPSEDPYKEAAQQLLEQAPRSPEYVPDPIKLEDHVPTHIPEHPEDLVPVEDEEPIEAYIPEDASAPTPPLPPSFLSLRIRPPHTRAAMAQIRAAVPSTYHLLLPSGTPQLLPIPLPVPSTSRRAEIPEADTLPRKRLLLTAPRPWCEVVESSVAAAARQPGPTMAHSVDCSFVDTMETRFRDTERRMMTTLEMVNIRVSYQVDVHIRESSEFYSRHHDAQKDCAAVRAKIEVLRRERLAYEQERFCKIQRVLYFLVIRRKWHQNEQPGQQQTGKQPTPHRYRETTNTTSVTNAQLQAMVDQGVTATLAAHDALRSTNGDDSHNSRMGVKRTE